MPYLAASANRKDLQKKIARRKFELGGAKSTLSERWLLELAEVFNSGPRREGGPDVNARKRVGRLLDIAGPDKGKIVQRL
jgi:hypothetical protein